MMSIPDPRLRSALAAIRRDRLAVFIYVIVATPLAAALISADRLWAVVALPPAIFGPWGIVASSAMLRLASIGTGFSDQVVVSEAARLRVLTGASPYGVGYQESIPPGSPFPYGPLALVDSVPLELVASIGLLFLLAWSRRPITLALYAGLPFSIVLASAGNNDYVPALLLAAGLLWLPSRGGGALIALSAVWKPYTVVFVPVALAAGSMAAFLVSVAVLCIGWLPAVLWGGFMESLAMLNAGQAASPLRYLAGPVSLTALRWGTPAACLAFALLTMTSESWSLSYVIPLGIALGIALEPAFRPLESVATSQSPITPESR